jgi:hypothetical protein
MESSNYSSHLAKWHVSPIWYLDLVLLLNRTVTLSRLIIVKMPCPVIMSITIANIPSHPQTQVHIVAHVQLRLSTPQTSKTITLTPERTTKLQPMISIITVSSILSHHKYSGTCIYPLLVPLTTPHRVKIPCNNSPAPIYIPSTQRHVYNTHHIPLLPLRSITPFHRASSTRCHHLPTLPSLGLLV